MGDYDKGNDSVTNLLSYLNRQGCDRVICACNNNIPGTINSIMAYSNHLLIDKTITFIPAEQRIKNGEDAETIYKLL